MSDWKSRAVPVTAGTNDWKSRAISTGPQLKADEDPGIARSIASKAAQGFSFGLSDELAGGIGAAGRAVGLDNAGGQMKNIGINSDGPTLDLDKLKQAYIDNRDGERNLQHQADKYNPGISLASEIAGGIANPLNRIPVKGVGNAAVMAARQGALYGLGNSNADNAAGMIEDTGKGAALGAAFSPLATGVSKLSVPKMGQLLTGVPESASQAYLKHMPFVDKLSKEGGVLPYVEGVTSDIGKTLQSAKTQYGQNVAAAIDGAGSVPISDVSKPFLDRLNLLKSKSNITNADQAEINSLQGAYDKYFGLANETPQKNYLPESVDGNRLFDLQKKLKQAAAFETNMTPETLSMKSSARGAYQNANTALDNATQGLSSEAKIDYAKHMSIESEIGNKFENPQNTYNTLTGLDTNGRKMLSERLKELASKGQLDVTDPAEKLQAFKYFSDPSTNQLSGGGATSTSRTKAGTGIGALIGGGIGNLLGGPAVGATGAAIGGATAPLVFNPQNLKGALKASDFYNQNFSPFLPSPQTLNATVPSSIYDYFGQK